MRITKLIRSVPFLFSLTVVLLLNINNQKQVARLKILLWNTPSLPIGTYITIASGTGFLLSYIITTNLSRDGQVNIQKEIKYKFENKNEQSNVKQEIINELPYENTFIERDVKDPSPTINANFRVISKTNNFNQSLRNNIYKNNSASGFSDDKNSEYFEQEINFEYDKEKRKISNDWDDNSYLDW